VTISKRRRDGIRSEYEFDYAKAKPNRFSKGSKAGCRLVQLEPDVAKVFTTAGSVNSVLRALIANMPGKDK
jgi:hypothetical protein